MKNNLQDLNDILFQQLDRLNSDDLKGDELKAEIMRSKAVTDVAGSVVENASLQLEATKLRLEYGNKDLLKEIPESILPKKVLPGLGESNA